MSKFEISEVSVIDYWNLKFICYWVLVFWVFSKRHPNQPWQFSHLSVLFLQNDLSYGFNIFGPVHTDTAVLRLDDVNRNVVFN